jgi:hypothetical protein
MKILYVTDYRKSYSYAGFVNDYLNDLIFYGLTELDYTEVVSTIPIAHLYTPFKESIEPKLLWGKGFTSSFLLDSLPYHNTKDILDKINNKYFDYVVYGSVHRCLDGYQDLCRIYGKSRIILVDGEDSTAMHPLHTDHLYFKRELMDIRYGIPIHFAIPEKKINKTTQPKTQFFATVIPHRSETYIFNDADSYYNDYNISYFGLTQKKAGWDCMRHYEILGNNCVPLFVDIQNCPPRCLTNLPKNLLIEANNLINNMGRYNDIQKELTNFTKNNLTTKKLAEYLISFWV